jgi:predicted nucleic acid-binding protein
VIILDTNVLSELLRPRPAEQVLGWLDAQNPDDLCTTVVSVQESFFGAECLSDIRRQALLERLEALYEGLPVLPYDETSARYTAVLLARARSSGRAMHQADAQIAGIALRHEATLATRNTKDFAHSAVSLHDPWLA